MKDDQSGSGGTCVSCGASIEKYPNYCDWQCQIDLAKANGGEEYAPNGLPIVCIKADNSMLEHEHGDHQSYMFPVDVEFAGERPALPDWDTSYTTEVHALIYTDGCVALTLYECCYALFGLSDGMMIRGSLWDKAKWRLTLESREKIEAASGPLTPRFAPGTAQGPVEPVTVVTFDEDEPSEGDVADAVASRGNTKKLAMYRKEQPGFESALAGLGEPMMWTRLRRALWDDFEQEPTAHRPAIQGGRIKTYKYP